MNETILTLDESIQILSIGCILMFFTSFLAWKNGYYELPKDYADEPKLSLKVVIISFLIFLSTSIVIVPLIFVLTLYILQGNLDLTTAHLVLINTLSIAVTFLAFGIFFLFLSVENRKLILGKLFGPKIGFNKTIKDISMGILSWFISFPVVLVAGKLIGIIFELLGIEVIVNQVAVEQVKAALSSKPLFISIALGIVFFVPIIEEFLFRGCLQTWIKGKVGVKKAILLTSLVFAFFHFSLSQGLGNIELLASLFILSCFLGLIYEKQQSLLASISLHAFFNAVTVLMIALS